MKVVRVVINEQRINIDVQVCPGFQKMSNPAAKTETTQTMAIRDIPWNERNAEALLAVVVGVDTAVLVDETSPSAEGAPPNSVLAKAQTFRIPLTTAGTFVVFRNEVWLVFSKLFAPFRPNTTDNQRLAHQSTHWGYA